MKTVRTLSATQDSSLHGPIFSSTLLRPIADIDSRGYQVGAIAAILLLLGGSAVTALPLFAPSPTSSASGREAEPVVVAARITSPPDDISSHVVGAVSHSPAVNTDDDALSLGSGELVRLVSASDQDASGIEVEALAVEGTAPATDGDEAASDSSQQDPVQTADDQPSAGVAPADSSGDGTSQEGGSNGDPAANDGDIGGNGQGEGGGNSQPNDNDNGGGPSDNSQGNGPPQDTPGNAPAGDNPSDGSPQGNPAGQGSGQEDGNGNGQGSGNGKK